MIPADSVSMPPPDWETDFDLYQYDVVRTLATHADHGWQIAICGLGLAGEVGETIDILKKHIGFGHEMDDLTRAKLLAELGDVMWYVTALAHLMDMKLTEIVNHNVIKLQRRYPNGFTTEASINRPAD